MADLKEDGIKVTRASDIEYGVGLWIPINEGTDTYDFNKAEQLKEEILEALEFYEKIGQYLDTNFLNGLNIENQLISKTKFKELKKKADRYKKYQQMAIKLNEDKVQLEAQVKTLQEKLSKYESN